MKVIIFILIVLVSSCAKDHTYKKSISAENLKLCFIGDTGTNNNIQKAVTEVLSREKCHTIHVLGDVIYSRGLKSPEDKNFYKKFWDHYGPIAKKDHRPLLYLIMGNHDHRRSIKHWITLSKKYPEIFYPNPYYLIRLNHDVCLVHLDSEYYKLISNFFVGIGQINWLDRIEDEMKSCKVRIALTHHPYENSGSHHGPSKGWVRNFLKNNVIGKFDYLISGHEHHLSDEGVKDGTRMLISGAGGNTKKIEDAGYLVFDLDQNFNVKYEFRRLTK